LNSKPTIVCNAGPLMALGKLNMLYLLERLYQRVYVGLLVYNEVVIESLAKGYPDARLAEIYFERGILIKTQVEQESAVNQLAEASGIHRGEAETIILAKQLKSDLVLIDDLDARRVARSENLKVKGTLGVLVEAHKEDYFTLSELEIIFQQIAERSDIWIAEGLCRRVLEELRKTG